MNKLRRLIGSELEGNRFDRDDRIEKRKLSEETSKKDYVQVAKILKKFLKSKDTEKLLNDFVNFFKADNPRFNEDKFREFIGKE